MKPFVDRYYKDFINLKFKEKKKQKKKEEKEWAIAHQSND